MERESGVFEQICREYEFGVGTIARLAKKLGLHRRIVREVVCFAEAPQETNTHWKLKAAIAFIDAILERTAKHCGNSATLPTGLPGGPLWRGAFPICPGTRDRTQYEFADICRYAFTDDRRVNRLIV